MNRGTRGYCSPRSESMQALNLSRPRWAALSSELERCWRAPCSFGLSEAAALRHFYVTEPWVDTSWAKDCGQ
ncbi:uncharacterized protein ACO6RY_17081 [Pungitius sinensis]